MKKKSTARSGKQTTTISSYLFLAPFFISFLLFTVVPIVCAVGLSFTDFDMVSLPSFTGISNYARMFLDDDVFGTVIKNTLVFAIITGPISYFLCLILAWLINEMNRPLRVVMTAVFYLPSTLVSAVTIFSYVFSGDSYGLVNSVFMQLGIIQDPILWLSDPKYNLGVVILVQLWISLGVGFLSFIAGFQSIDSSIYESGSIDGIHNRFQEFYYLTLPSMRPQLMFGAIMQITASFSVSAVPIALTGFPSTNNSTTTIVTHIMDVSTNRIELGYACAIAVFLFVVMLITRNIVARIIKSD